MWQLRYPDRAVIYWIEVDLEHNISAIEFELRVKIRFLIRPGDYICILVADLVAYLVQWRYHEHIEQGQNGRHFAGVKF